MFFVNQQLKVLSRRLNCVLWFTEMEQDIFFPRVRDWMGVMPAKPGDTSWGLPAGLRVNCIKQCKTFLSCPETALTTRVF